MKRKLLALLLALGCVVGLGGAVACDEEKPTPQSSESFMESQESVGSEEESDRDSSEEAASSESVGESTSEMESSSEEDVEVNPDCVHTISYLLTKSSTEGFYTLKSVCDICDGVVGKEEIPKADCVVMYRAPTCMQEGLEDVSYTRGEISVSMRKVYEIIPHSYNKDNYILEKRGERFFLSFICDMCTGKGEKEAVGTTVSVYKPTCTKDGYTQYTYEEKQEVYTTKTAIVSALGHSLQSRWDIKTGKTLCEDGGTYITACTRSGCGYVKSKTSVEAQGHHFDTWTEKLAPTTISEGKMEGVCTGCSISVDGKMVSYAGCGNKVEKILPVLSNKDYTVTEDSFSCTNGGTVTYTTTIDGKTVSYEVVVPKKNHKIRTSDGSEEIEVCSKIDVNDKKYWGSWDYVAGHELKCNEINDNEEEAMAFFQCDECGNVVVIYIVGVRRHNMKYSYISENETEYIFEYACSYSNCEYTEGNKNVSKTLCKEEIVQQPTCGDRGIKEIKVYTTTAKTTLDYVVEVSIDRTGLHKIGTSDGPEEIVVPSKIDADDEKYAGSWELLGGREIRCDNEEGTGAVFKCTECAKPCIIYIVMQHTVEYEYVSENEREYIFEYACSYSNCEYTEGNKNVSKTLCKEEIVQQPTCGEEGVKEIKVYTTTAKTTLDYVVEVWIEVTGEHIHNGEVIKAGDIVNYITHSDISILDTGNIFNCANHTLGVFKCEKCYKKVLVQLYIPHTKPDGVGEGEEYDCTACGNRVSE